MHLERNPYHSSTRHLHAILSHLPVRVRAQPEALARTVVAVADGQVARLAPAMTGGAPLDRI